MNIEIFEDIILNTVLIVFPILVYLVLVCYKNDINKNYKYITINNDYDKNIFVTNRVEELDKIMEKYVNDNDDDISDAEIARVM